MKSHRYTRRELAELLTATGLIDVTQQTLAYWVEQGLPQDEGNGIDIIQFAAWCLKRKTRKELAAEDPNLVGPNSPALERYRLARAKNEELALAHNKEQLVKVAEIKREFQLWAAKLKTGLDAVATRHGPEVSKDIRLAVDEVYSEMERKYGAKAPRKESAHEELPVVQPKPGG